MYQIRFNTHSYLSLRYFCVHIHCTVSVTRFLFIEKKRKQIKSYCMIFATQRSLMRTIHTFTIKIINNGEC